MPIYNKQISHNYLKIVVPPIVVGPQKTYVALLLIVTFVYHVFFSSVRFTIIFVPISIALISA